MSETVKQVHTPQFLRFDDAVTGEPVAVPISEILEIAKVPDDKRQFIAENFGPEGKPMLVYPCVVITTRTSDRVYYSYNTFESLWPHLNGKLI